MDGRKRFWLCTYTVVGSVWVVYHIISEALKEKGRCKSSHVTIDICMGVFSFCHFSQMRYDSKLSLYKTDGHLNQRWGFRWVSYELRC